MVQAPFVGNGRESGPVHATRISSRGPETVPHVQRKFGTCKAYQRPLLRRHSRVRSCPRRPASDHLPENQPELKQIGP